MKRHLDERTIVVTGGSGLIGSAVIGELNHRGFNNIVILDELDKTEKWRNLVGKQFLELIPKEETFSFIEERGNDIQAVIHLGACSSTVETDSRFLHENNTRFSQKLYDASQKNGYRFIYASSAATYGDGSNGYKDDESQLHQLHPLNMYGLSKHWFDLWLQRQTNFENAAGLKYFNVFGPNEYHKGRMASAVFHMLPVAQNEHVVKLFKSLEPEKYEHGGQMRDFLYVKDAARMTCDFLHTDAQGIYNIGSGKASKWNDLATYLFEALKMPVKIEYIPTPSDLVGKYQNYSCACMDKTRSVIGNAVQTIPLKDAVHDYVTNYLLKGNRCL